MTNVMSEPVTFQSAFERLSSDGPFHARRADAFARFNELGVPTTRLERWRYTSLRDVGSLAYIRADDGVAGAADAAAVARLPQDAVATVMTFVNGRFSPDLSDVRPLPAGARLVTIADALAEGDATVLAHLADETETGDRYRDEAFTQLNTALFEDGVFLHLPKGVVVDQPIEVVFVTTAGPEPVFSCPRVLIVAEPTAQATLIERYVTAGNGAAMTAAVTEIVADDEANIDHYRILEESDETFHVSGLRTRLGRSTRVTSNAITFGGGIVRNNIDATHAAADGEAVFNGLTVTRGRQHVDHHLRIDHLEPHCRSWQFYKSVLAERSRGVFSGRIYVAEDAQKTDAKQTNMNLLLSPDAHVDTKPQLEIFADDVKCTHGATIGQIEESQLFYLRARGIDAASARAMLVHAFANETLTEIQVDALRAELEETLLQRLPREAPTNGA